MLLEKMANLTTGLWKFHESVPLEELQEVAEEWAKDESYVDERIDLIQEYLLKCFNIKRILPEYKEFVEVEFGLKVNAD